MYLNRKAFIIALVAAFILAGCNRLKDPDANYKYDMPNDAGSEFKIASLADEQVDEEPITRLTNAIIREQYKRIDGLLILKNNKLIYENYFHGYAADVPHNIYSAGKSITSILVGIAIDQGFIKDVDLPVLPLLPEYKSFQNTDARKERITIAHLLNMSSGLNCDDWYQSTESKMQESDDWVRFTLDLPMVSEPGTKGSYCTGCPVTLGRIIENMSGLSIQAFAKKYLFDPLGITNYQWHIMPDGKASAGGLFFLRPRDMAKIGLLMLNEGAWNGRQIVSREWVQRSGANQIKLAGPFDGYGFLWWKQTFDHNIASYFADGNGGQHIFVIPGKNLVIVFTGGNKNTDIGLQNFQIVNNYILPAVK